MSLRQGKKLTRRLLVIFVLCVSTVSQVQIAVAAPSAATRKSLDLQTTFYNPSTEGATSCVANSTLVGSENAERIYNFLLDKGLSPVQIAGFMGNWSVESKFDPRSYNPHTTTDDPEPSRAFGIVQWLGGRQTTLRKRAEAAGKPITDLQIQLDFAWEELTGPYKKSVLDPVLASSDLAEVVHIVNLRYEVSGTSDAPRLTDAQRALTKFGSNSSDTTTASEPVTTTTSTGGCTGTGTVNVDGYSFPVGPQTKSANSKNSGLSPLPCSSPTSCHHEFTPPSSYAFDIGRQPGGDSSEGAPVYAISDGTISQAHIYKGFEGCYSLQLHSSKDGFFYWYGHMKNLTVKDKDVVRAGQQIAEIGPSKCTGNYSTPHLHIDRGCIEHGQQQHGGSPSCRDEGIVPLMNSLFNGLPA